MPCILNSPLDDISKCREWNEHLIGINEIFESLSLPILLDVHDRRNAMIGFSRVDSPPKNVGNPFFFYRRKACFLSDKIWVKTWETDHLDMMNEASAAGADRAIFSTSDAIIYVDKELYFYIGSNVVYSLKENLHLSFGINALPSTIAR